MAEPQPRIPIHHVVVAVDMPARMELDEDLGDGAGVCVVHGEALVRVIRGRAKPLELLDDLRAVALAPGPDPFDERLAADIPARRALAGELLLDLRLGGDAGMVGAHDPARRLTSHPVEPDQGVLDRAVERMAHVKDAGDVGRRHGDREVLLRLTLGLGVEVAAFIPLLEDPPLDLRRVVASGALERLFGLVVHPRRC